MTKNFIILALMVMHVGVLAQKRYTNPEKAEQLKTLYPEAKIVSSDYNSQYIFNITSIGLQVEQKEQTDLISLESNLKYYKNVYYNNNVDLTHGSAKYSSGRGILKYNKVYGNYEVDDIFYSDAKVGHFSFDMLYESTEVTFRSTCLYKDPKYLTKVFIHDSEPVHKREISFHIPHGVDVELIEMNFEGYNITRTEEDKDGISVIRFNCEQLKELKDEDSSQGILYHAPHIVVVTKSYMADGNKRAVIGNVNDLYNWYHSLAQQVEIDNSPYSTLVEKLTADEKSEEEKIKKIYYWVQENIKYIAFEDGIAGFKPDTPQNVYNNRYGDCKGMAILTKSMLQLAGIDARLTWIGTSKIPYNYDIPSLGVDNHMICTAFVGEKMYVLDATEKYIALGKNAERIQGKEMLIEDGENFLRRHVPIHSADNNLLLRTESIRIESNNLIGNGTLLVNGETKKDILYLSNNTKVEDKSDLFDYLSVSESTNEDIVQINNTPESDRDKPLELSYNYNLANRISEFDNELFIGLDWDQRMSGANIDKNRKSTFSFGKKVKSKTIKTLTIPKGYKLSYLPEEVKFCDGEISVNVGMQSNGKTITYTNQVTVNNGLILPNQFEKWNTLVEQLNTFYNDQIILKKL
ncbi:transglutaminase domain-containing protein [Carboxylicivirga marina]|uniref:Transglutaminase domain-containing protein n=1 Tax=Carboxylicivirga marina TaxID=2800988 RepID=A0ABS1HE36_9BACT|nr:transglutaminase domain-containing protein [Carboxylicivirga marina]MBK3515935.1 transglutaminase domain-containing protein [Carboxylicivirga marina]